MKKILFGLFFCLLPLFSCNAAMLPADKAFVLSVKPADTKTLTAHWDIAPGYHLNKDSFNFNIVSPSSTQLGTINYPAGIAKHSDVLGDYQVYEKAVDIPLPLTNANAKQVTVAVTYQGCSDSGFCLPPKTKQFTVDLTNAPVAAATTASADPTATNNDANAQPQDSISAMLSKQNIFVTLLAFFGFGILLAFTPCILPMIPILSGIIVGQGKQITTLKAFWLSLTYVLAMAVTYAVAGVIAGLAGSYVQGMLQNPWVIGSFSVIFVLLALSLFGFYELRMPNFLHATVSEMSNKQSGGTYVGVGVMGVLSTLIVSPCVTAPLVGALGYIGRTGNAVLGGSALFTLGLGMGLPLLIIGTAGGKFLPKAGGWMDSVKAFFGVLMLGVAILMIGRIVTPELTMVLWAALLVISAVYMGAFTHVPNTGFGKLWKGISVILLVYGLILLVGAGMGNTNPLTPLSLPGVNLVSNAEAANSQFTVVKSLPELQKVLATAQTQNKPAMLDFSAEWCVSCKELDHSTFKDPQVQNVLNQFVLIRADVTDDNAEIKALEKQFNIFAPPAIVFFDTKSQEIPSARVAGAMGPEAFLDHLKETLKQASS